MRNVQHGDPSLPAGLYARTLALPLGTGIQSNTAISGVDPREPHIYRIEWSATEVNFYVDDRLVAVATSSDDIAGPMRAVVSDLGLGGNLVGVHSLAMGPLPSTGSFVSPVQDAGDSRGLSRSFNATRHRVPHRGRLHRHARRRQLLCVRAARDRGRQQSERALHPVPHEPEPCHAQPRQGPYQLPTATAARPSTAISCVHVSGTCVTVICSPSSGDGSRPVRMQPRRQRRRRVRAVHESEHLRSLASGLHTISVRGVDKFGNVGETVARRFRLRADKTAPKV